MDDFEQNKKDKTHQSTDTDVDNVVDIAIARMKAGTVEKEAVKEERKSRFKFVFFAALAIAGLAAFSTLDFVYQTPESETKPNGDIVITLKQGQSGHYMATGLINDEKVRFIVDTGATNVAIPMEVAKRLNLPLGLKYETFTANGTGTSYETRIKSIQLGDIRLTDVDASVSVGLQGDQALLGMSFLGRTRVVQDKGVMKITY